MMVLDDYRVRVHILLEPGIYGFEPISGEGKTYLAKLLNMYRSSGERCASYTYGSHEDLIGVLDSSKYDVVLLDRYDMYYGEALEEIKSFAEKGVVLIDCKRRFSFYPCKPCSIIRTVDKVTVEW